MVQPELINISAILNLSLLRKAQSIHRLLNAIISFSHVCNRLYACNTTIVSTAIVFAKEDAPELEASLWKSMGDTLRFQQQYDEALFALSKALELCRIAGDQKAAASNLLSLGILSKFTNKDEEAERFLHSALDLYTKLDMPVGVARALRELGEVYGRDRDRDRNDETERRVLRAALDIYEQIGSQQGKADVLLALGHFDIVRGRLDEAKNALTIALDLNNKLDHPLSQANAMVELSHVYARLHCGEKAEATLQSALDIYRALNNRLGQAISFRHLGELYQGQNLHDKAVHALEAAAKLDGDLGDHQGKAHSLLVLGRSYLNLAQLDDAERSMGSALTLFRDLHDRRWESMTLLDLGHLRCLQRRYEEACNMLHSAHDIAAELSDLQTQGVALQRVGHVHRVCGGLATAQRCFEDALQLFERAESVQNADITRTDLEALRLKRQSIEGQENTSQGVATMNQSSEAQEVSVSSTGG
ncbi:TPR-like protein [Peniophora sp. CONT]|nr:TPR-like protein [Peniophora sp. CONT]